ncbi:MAG: hypothetical protein Q8Q52_01895 [Acidimicrobiia bacterium]|nr:hypothetical protein [Acidimicrobiia bacterium]
MIANLPESWSVYDGQGAGSAAEVVRRFDLIDGGGERVSPKNESLVPDQEQGSPVPWQAHKDILDRLQANHDREMARMQAAHNKEMDRLMGDR